ncbi:MAG: T9SS type A sorting domain-containing protein [Balneolales bacterium]
MLHLLKSSRNALIPMVFLLLTLTAKAIPPTDSISPAPFYSSLEALNEQRSLGTIRILAVMAEFREEENRFTTGNGTFDLPFLKRDDDEIVIDPLPHDQSYFEAHLEFAKNYFHSVSGGRLTIEYQVLQDVIQLDEPMSTYSPIGENDDENYKLAHLARDAWSKVRDADLPDLSGYEQERTLFIVFHAGSGRNIELLGTTLKKTPQDIPSVYLGTHALQRLLELNDFEGFDIGDTNIRATNTTILPQTQSRVGEDFTGAEYVLQLSINGLLAANIGSFLGLPDLFNTETGSSAIGRFGLMDGASIFSYLGLFPPEPSAWEKMHLGWQQPFDITLDSGDSIPLPAVSKRQPNSIARHAISDDEYYLIENRHRNPTDNPDTDPLEITIRTPEQQLVTKSIAPDDLRFNPFNASEYDEILKPGVIVNVSNFDWSLPGGLDVGADGETGTGDDRYLNGGILIWHIDEAVIRNSIEDNKVNANSDRRGVRLVEADGARDIGRAPGMGQDRFNNGHAFDFWWSENDFTVITATGDSVVIYQENGNRFGPNTRPSNESNTGSPSFFEFYDFSDNHPDAWFFARSTSGKLVRPVDPPFPRLSELAGYHAEATSFPVSPEIVSLQNSPENRITRFHQNPANRHGDPLIQSFPDDRLLLVPTMEGFYSIPLNRREEDYAFIDHPSPSSPLIHNGIVTAGQFRSSGETDKQNIISWSYNNSEWIRQWQSDNQPVGPGLVSMENGNIIQLDQTPIRIETDGTLLTERNGKYQSSGEVDGITGFIEDDRFELSDGSYHYDLDENQRKSHRKYTGNLRFGGNTGPSFFILTDNRFMLIDRSSRNDWRPMPVFEGNNLSWPSFGDWTGDNTLEILITDSGNAIYGFNRDGGMIDYFPLHAPSGNRFIGAPLLADITGDGHLELLTAVKDSLTMMVHAYNRYLDPIDGFPLMVGSLSDSGELIPLPLLIEEGHLFAISPGGIVRAWELLESGEIAWGRTYGPQNNNKAGFNMDRDEQLRVDFGILNEQETYNWPNPADDHTFIRYETSEPARVDLTVINPGGAIVLEKQTESQGRYPEEMRLNTSSWGNGIYFGRIRVDNGQNSETKLIKIVITH